MNIFQRLKLIFSRNIDDYFKKSRRMFVPVVKGGMWVDHETALSLAAVFSAVRYVSESVASLPWELRRRKREGGSEHALTHNVYRLIHTRPNPEMSSFDWRVLMIAWANLWGNAYAEISFDSMRRPTALWPINPDRVTPRRENGVLYYEIFQKSSENIILMPENMFHIRGVGDTTQGYSVVSLAARSIGQGLASDEFSASFFQNGVVTSGSYVHPKGLGDAAFERLKQQLQEKHAGPRNAWKPLLLEDGLKWEPISMPLKDAQFLESRKFTVTEIARWFRVPPHKIADLDRATFSNIEEQNIDVVQETIIPWAIRLEQEVNHKLISPMSQNVFFSKININGMLRGDSIHRANYYHQMRNMGVLNVNEIRELEDMNPIGAKGEKYVMQGQYTTLEKIGEKQEPPPQFQQGNEEDEEEENINAAWRPIIFDALNRVEARRKNRLGDALEHMNEENFNSWLPKFVKEHSQYSISAMRPSFMGYAQALGVMDFVSLETYLSNIMTRDKESVFHGQEEEDLWSLVENIQNEIKSLRRYEYAVTVAAS
jgi:HK97 family phage portal protein